MSRLFLSRNIEGENNGRTWCTSLSVQTAWLPSRTASPPLIASASAPRGRPASLAASSALPGRFRPQNFLTRTGVA
jgi:hypothetical protein